MAWPSLRRFLGVPETLTGRGARIALVDGTFAPHPDVASDGRRRTFLVETSTAEPRPVRLDPAPAPWHRGAAHGVWAAAAAAGSGALCGGRFAGVAPEAELFLIAGWTPGRPPREDQALLDRVASLRWVLDHHREWGIRAVLTSHTRGDSPLLPWQTDPQRRVAEALAAAGVLVVAGAGNTIDSACMVSLAAAPSALAVGGVVVTEDGDIAGAADAADAAHAPPYHGCRGTTFEGKWVPDVLAPSENLVLPYVSQDDLRDHFCAEADRGAVPAGYARTEGASFGGPVALGAAACLWQAHPEWTAHQVAAALAQTALHRPQWAPLRAGLLSVSDAAAAAPHTAGEDGGDTAGAPYTRWRAWRGESPATRLRAARGSDEVVAVEALLSFLPEEAPPEAGGAALGLASAGHAPATLRAAALCVLATGPATVTVTAVERGLCDPDARVRAAALHCLERCPQHWESLATALAGLLLDRDPDVRRHAVALAGQVRDARFVPALVAGLEDAAHRSWTNAFGRSCQTLTAITGVDLPQDPPWRIGECSYTERRRRARLAVAERWRAWLRARYP